MRAKNFLGEAAVKTPIAFLYTGNDGRDRADVVYINIDSRDLMFMLMYCMEADNQFTGGMIAELSSKYASRYWSAVAKRKKELGVK